MNVHVGERQLNICARIRDLPKKRKFRREWFSIFCATDSSANTGSWCCCALCLYQGSQGPLDLNSPCSGRDTAPRCSRWAQCCRDTSPWAEMCRGASWDPRWTWGWSGSGWTFPCRILQRKSSIKLRSKLSLLRWKSFRNFPITSKETLTSCPWKAFSVSCTSGR